MDRHPRRVRKTTIVETADTPESAPEFVDEILQDVPVKPPTRGVWIVYGVLILLGIVTGYMLTDKKTSVTGGMFGGNTKSVGITDTRIYKDSAEGVIEAGGIDGEGTHKLVREGGPSQTAYLISTAVNLDDFIGKKVKIYGQTVSAKKAAWLMDVGKIDLLSE